MTIDIMEDHKRFLKLFVQAGVFSDEITAAVAILKSGIDDSEWDVSLNQSEIPDDIGEPDIDEDTVLQGPICKLELPKDEELERRLNRLMGGYTAWPRWKIEAATFAQGLSAYYYELRTTKLYRQDKQFAATVDEMPHETDEEPG